MHLVSPQHFDHCNDAYSLSIRLSTDHAKPHFDLFFPTISTSKECFFSERELENDIARHIEASSVEWTLIDNGKLANQIARLAAIVVKYSVPTVYFAVTIYHVLLLS